jgi:hypothetical protein
LFVAFAAVIGDIKPAALEEQPGTGADFALHAATAPRLPGTGFLRTNPQRTGGHGLNGFKLTPAFFTEIFVSRHGLFQERPLQQQINDAFQP